MPRSSRWIEVRGRPDDCRRRVDDAGSAAVEFVFAGLILLVPLVYVVVALGAVQAQTLGAESAARHIARALATADGQADAGARADSILGTVAEEYGMDPASLEVAVTCDTAASPCPRAGATVTVSVATRVVLPLAPPLFGLDRLASIPVEAAAVQKVSRFWTTGS